MRSDKATMMEKTGFGTKRNEKQNSKSCLIYICLVKVQEAIRCCQWSSSVIPWNVLHSPQLFPKWIESKFIIMMRAHFVKHLLQLN